jgi:AraC-like DNA-binding protein
MRVARIPTIDALTQPPLWPPLLATRGQGGKSDEHAHHAMHLMLCYSGELSVRLRNGESRRAAGVLTAADIPHSIDARGSDVLLVFFDPESHVGAALARTFDTPLRLITSAQRKRMLADAEPTKLMHSEGVAWTERLVSVLGGDVLPERKVHPRVRKVLKVLREAESGREYSLEDLAALVSLSPSRLMHAFTESVGIPLRPYLAWLKLQRAAAAIVSGMPLVHAANAAGFSDAAHMSRTFRRMLGMAPSALIGKRP